MRNHFRGIPRKIYNFRRNLTRNLQEQIYNRREQVVRAGCKLLRANCQSKYQHSGGSLQSCAEKNIRFDCNIKKIINVQRGRGQNPTARSLNRVKAYLQALILSYLPLNRLCLGTMQHHTLSYFPLNRLCLGTMQHHTFYFDSTLLQVSCKHSKTSSYCRNFSNTGLAVAAGVLQS